MSPGSARSNPWKIEIEKGKGGKDRMVITEIPYTMIGANIGKFLNDVYGLVESKATSDITDITNQSSKEGIRIVLELKKEQISRLWRICCTRKPSWKTPLVSICLR